MRTQYLKLSNNSESGSTAPKPLNHTRTASKCSFQDSMLLETLVQTKGSSSLRELRDNLAIHGDWGVLTIFRHVRTKLPSGQKYSRKRLGKCASKLIYCKRHVFSCQTVDKSATIICISGAKTLPSGRVTLKFHCQNFEF